MKTATALLLNWKRSDNMHKVIKSIREQTANIKIFLWNNNFDDLTDYGADVQVNSSQNFYCWPRWLMGSLADTDFIFTLDDDLMLTRPTFIEQCMGYCEDLPVDDIILGLTGVILNKNNDYWQSEHIVVSNGVQDRRVDIIKGRFMFMRRDYLDGITLKHGSQQSEDIYISSFSNNKIVPAMSCGAWCNLPEGSEALFRQPGHAGLRQEMVNNMFMGDS